MLLVWVGRERVCWLPGSSVMSSVHRQSGHRSNPPQALQTVPQHSHRSPVQAAEAEKKRPHTEEESVIPDRSSGF